MIAFLSLAAPTLGFAFGVFPTASIYCLSIVMCVFATLRYIGILSILAGFADPVPSKDKQNVQNQWLVTLASFIAMVALWQAGALYSLVYFGVTVPFSLYFLTKTTFAPQPATVDETPDDLDNDPHSA